jgi:hypothetical protein
MLTRAEKKAANKAAYAGLRVRYDALSTEQRDLMKAEFAAQRIRSADLGWPQFLAVALPMMVEMAN